MALNVKQEKRLLEQLTVRRFDDDDLPCVSSDHTLRLPLQGFSPNGAGIIRRGLP